MMTLLMAFVKKSKNRKEQIRDNGSKNELKNSNSKRKKATPGRHTGSRTRNSKSTNLNSRNNLKLRILRNFGTISESKNSVDAPRKKKCR